MKDEVWIAVRLPLDNPLLREDGLARYGDFVQVARKRLAKARLGYFEGAMTGTSIVNLSFSLVPKGDAERAVAIVVDALKECGYERQAIVSHGGFITRAGRDSHFEKAVWPPDFTGEIPD